jgi:hypothetical protein
VQRAERDLQVRLTPVEPRAAVLEVVLLADAAPE